MDDILKSIYDSQNDIWGYPQIYKSINFHPIKLKDVQAQKLFYKVFQYPKTCITDKKIIKMTYLKYLLFIIQKMIDVKGNQITKGLLDFLKYCTKIEDIDYVITKINIPDDDEKDPLKNMIIKIKIGDQEFTEEDFDIIRGIILEQNALSTEYIESFNPELEKFLDYSNRKGNISIEDQIFTYCALMKKSIRDIEDLTLYQFKKLFERITLLLDHELYSPLEISGQIKAKNGKEIVKHYLSPGDKRKGRYDSILIPKDEFLSENPDIADENGERRYLLTGGKNNKNINN